MSLNPLSSPPSQSIKSIGDLGMLIRKERKKQVLNQTELAGLSNVGNRFLVELEQGKSSIEFDKTLHVAQMLGISFKASFPSSHD